MAKLILVSILFSFVLPGFAQAQGTCRSCQQMTAALNDLQSKKAAFDAKELEQNKHHVIFGPTEERKQFELSQGRANLLVCEFQSSGDKQSRTALVNFVIAIYNMDIDATAIADLFSCFNTEYTSHKAAFDEVTTDANRAKLNLVIAEGASDFQDEEDNESVGQSQ